jgi:hypothetical protein
MQTLLAGMLGLCLLLGGLFGPAVAVVDAAPPTVSSASESVGGDAPVVQAVDAGMWHTCAIRADGTIACWGGGDIMARSAPPTGRFAAVAAGAEYSCGIRVDGTIACWGENDDGESTPPVGIFTALDTSGGTICAIAADGTLACWGFNEHGEASPPTGRFVAVSAGGRDSCGIRDSGALVCWGQMFGWPGTTIDGSYTAVSSGSSVCAIREDATLLCLDGPSPPAGRFTAISDGCAIRDDGTLACWSGNDYLGVPPEGTFKALSTGDRHACAIRTDDTLVCWGQNWHGAAVPAPTASLAHPGRWHRSTHIRLHWSARPAFVPVVSYDVRFRRARWNGDFGPWTRWRTATTATTATFVGAPGYTYCFSTRARDAAGVRSAWTGQGYYDWVIAGRTCTAIPLDDRSIARSSGWSARTSTSTYRNTYLVSTRRGASLTLSGVVAHHIGLLATTCPTCGTIEVSWPSFWRPSRISLYSRRRVDRKWINIADYLDTSTSPNQTGTLRIKVVSRGRPVMIDGVAIYRRP